MHMKPNTKLATLGQASVSSITANAQSDTLAFDPASQVQFWEKLDLPLTPAQRVAVDNQCTVVPRTGPTIGTGIEGTAYVCSPRNPGAAAFNLPRQLFASKEAAVKAAAVQTGISQPGTLVATVHTGNVPAGATNPQLITHSNVYKLSDNTFAVASVSAKNPVGAQNTQIVSHHTTGVSAVHTAHDYTQRIFAPLNATTLKNAQRETPRISL